MLALIGFVVGLCVMGLGFLIVTTDVDEDADDNLRRLQHTCTDRCRPVAERHFDEMGRRIA